MKRHDECTQRKVHESIEETPHLSFLAKHDEELNPDTRLENMRQASDQKEERRKLFDGCFHAAGVRRRAFLNKTLALERLRWKILHGLIKTPVPYALL